MAKEKQPAVLLVNPPAPFLAFPNAAPHLGMGYLASYLRENGVDVDYLNCEKRPLAEVELPEGYDVYGFTGVSAQYAAARQLHQQVKKRKLGATAIGGAHASVMPEQCLGDGFDYVVRGYGEQALLAIALQAVDPGIIQGTAVRDVDSLPPPARDLLERNEYDVSWGNRTGHVFTSRGCPYSCYYCCSPTIYGRSLQLRDVSKVLAEIRDLRERGKDSIYFFDPTFTQIADRALQIARGLKEFDLKWTCQTRVDRVTPALLQEMCAAGCDQISFGIEAGAAEVHDNLGKQTSVDQNSLAIKMAHDAGMKVKAFLMGALPDDNWARADAFMEFILKNKPDAWLYSTFIPFPGTDYWNNPEKYGIRIVCTDMRAYYPLGLNGRGPVNTENRYLDRDRLQELRDHVLDSLREAVPNGRVERAISLFPSQKPAAEKYFDGLDLKYMW